MTDTIHLGLALIEASQAQKHVTHNEALVRLDTLVQLAVVSRDLTAPPSTPAEGDRYIVKPTGTGAFAGKNNQIAHYSDGGWLFYPPQTGWLAYVADDGVLVAWNGSVWASVVSSSGDVTELQDLTLLGVGAIADSTNPFSAKLNNALWTSKSVGEGGDGSLRYKLSKESAAKTLSILYQDNYSGRAEIGLTGDDDFHFKVSPDGSSWIDALILDKSTGSAKLNAGVFLTGDISPSQVTSDQNDYSPTGLSAASVLRLSTDASRNITGLAGGADGRVVAIINAGTNNVVLKDGSTSSSAANRFSFGNDVTLGTKQSALLWFDATDSRWKLLAAPGVGGGGSVSSVFGRTGAVAAASGDYSISQISNARDVLTANRTYYVRTDGSDSNDGRANTSGGAFITIQKAIDTAAALDLSIYDVTIQVGSGTYTGALVLKSTVGAGKIIIQGDTATPSNVVISVTGASAISATNVRGYYVLKGFKTTTATSGHHIYNTGSKVEIANWDFGAAPSGHNHIYMEAYAYTLMSGNYAISSGISGGIHWAVRSGSYLDCRSLTITLTGTPAFSIFAYVDLMGNVLAASDTFSGSATGQRYNASGNAVVFTGGGGASYFPGNSAGATASGAQYI